MATDDIPRLAAELNLVEAAGASSQDWDQQCLVRMRVATKADRDRIVAAAAVEKRRK